MVRMVAWLAALSGCGDIKAGAGDGPHAADAGGPMRRYQDSGFDEPRTASPCAMVCEGAGARIGCREPDPLVVDFGTIGTIGSTARAFTVHNARPDGTACASVLMLTAIRSTTTAVAVEPPSPLPTDIVADGATVILRSTADAVGRFAGTIVVDTSAPDRPRIAVAVGGRTDSSPLCIARACTLDAPATDPSTPCGDTGRLALDVSPHTAVRLDATASLDNEGPLRYRWQLPPGASGDAAAALTTIAIADEGIYDILLRCTDGWEQTMDASVQLRVIAQDTMTVTLTWDDPALDFNLHVVRNADDLCGPQDLSVATMTEYTPDWCAPGPGDNPYMTANPNEAAERATIRPCANEVLVFVERPRTGGDPSRPGLPIVRIWCDGVLRAEYLVSMPDAGIRHVTTARLPGCTLVAGAEVNRLPCPP